VAKKEREAGQLPLTGSEAEILARLGQKVEKAIETIRVLRRERDELRQKLDDAEDRARESEGDLRQRVTELEDDCEQMRTERGEIEKRIEGILEDLATLDELGEEEEGEE
jgi:FtsZ-binding cell division protein ZapB